MAVGLQRALDAPAEFGEHDVDLLRFAVFYVVLDLQHERFYSREFGCVQLQLGQLFQNGPHLCLPFFFRPV